jgi:hypothetical protein
VRLVIFLILLSVNSWASTWVRLQRGQHYELLQDFQLQQLERSHSFIDFSKGEKYLLKEMTNIEILGALFTIFIFDYKNCPGTDIATKLEVISDKENVMPREFRSKVENCELRIYIENNDLKYQSIFE